MSYPTTRKAYICVGDRTTHGGVITQGSTLFIINGRPVARQGDLVTCPRCKGVFPITGCTAPTFDGGRPMAFDGCKTACGASLVPSQSLSFVGGSGDDLDALQSDLEAHEAAHENPSHDTPPEFNEHFVVLDGNDQPAEGVHYRLTAGCGRSFEGYTDKQGRTEVMWTTNPEPIELVILFDEDDEDDDDAYHVPTVE